MSLILGVGLLGMAVYWVAGSLTATVLWFCFDDALAELTGVAGLGQIAWHHVWVAVLFVGALLGPRRRSDRPYWSGDDDDDQWIDAGRSQ